MSSYIEQQMICQVIEQKTICQVIRTENDMPCYKNEKQYIKEKHTDREIGGWYECTGYRPILLQVIFTAYWTLFGKAC